MQELDTILVGDCLKRLRDFPDDSVDSVVTDPPYGISFMGKKWDYDVPKVELWQEVLRVLKPGGHALVACGTRTQHRMAVNLEDAGFEIRDMVFWHYGSGFPKSLNIEKALQKYANTKHEGRDKMGGGGLHDMSKEIPEAENLREPNRSELLQLQLQREDEGEEFSEVLGQRERQEEPQKRDEVRQKPSVEGRGDILEEARELQTDKVHSLSAGVSTNGEEGRIHNGTPANNGEISEQIIDEDRGGTSHQPRPSRQQSGKPDAFSEQQIAQAIRRFEGWGTALKPSTEIWTLCRKPLSENTVAENVLKYGCGGLNIDGSRVGTEKHTITGGGGGEGTGWGKKEAINEEGTGRFPANLIHDGSDEVVELFPNGIKPSFRKGDRVSNNDGIVPWNRGRETGREVKAAGYLDSGSAARFFYCAKASKSERNKGLEGFEEVIKAQLAGADNDTPTEELDDVSARFRSKPIKNFHPTVKPVALMRYLCKLITPPKGIVLDPFAGSGSTCIAAKMEGFQYIGIEKEFEYAKIAVARIAAVPQTLI